MNQSTPSRECMAFARALADHIDAARRGEQPAHAATCAACERRLRSALSLGGLLAECPKVPAELQRPQFLSAIFEREVEASEASPLGQSLAAAMQVEPVGDRLPWPVQNLDSALARHVAHADSRASTWVRPFVASGSERRLRLRRGVGVASTVAASIALLAVFGWRAARSEGTNADLQIVFVPVSEMPAVMHPTAVLRQAVIR